MARTVMGTVAAASMERDVAGWLAAEYPSLITYSRRLTANGPEATDLVHIVCTRVLSRGVPIADVGNPSGWSRTILFRVFVDLRRRAKWEIPTEAAKLDLPAAPSIESESGIKVTMTELRALLSALPAHYRVPYEMFTFEEMRYVQIGVVLGLSCATVGTRINRARERLRRMIRARHGL
jgi:RNA polymerase sigma-70 factor (ECF subfamily)